MAKSELDVVIIGGGNAGMGATIATGAGMSIAMIGPGLIGGTCSNRGCTSKKGPGGRGPRA